MRGSSLLLLVFIGIGILEPLLLLEVKSSIIASSEELVGHHFVTLVLVLHS